MNQVQMPPRIEVLERDHRGLPIPYIVMRDKDGKAVFAANDMMRVWRAVAEKRCHICGQALDPYPWFTGGPGSAFLNGDYAAYNDGPMHHECMQYAMQVCPYLTQIMTHAVGPAVQTKLKAQGTYVEDNTTIPGVPPIFVSVQADKIEITGGRMTPFYTIPKPWRKVEYWKAGQLMPKAEGESEAKRAARQLKQTFKR